MPRSNTGFQAIAEEKKVGIISTGAGGAGVDYAALADIVDKYRTVYVTVNKPVATIQKQLQEHGVETGNIFFIDAVTEKDDVPDNVLSIESPAHLTNLSIAIAEFANTHQGEPKFLIFDSLSTLPTYIDEKLFERFIHHLIGRIRGWRMGAAFLCAPNVLDEKTTATVNQLCDTVT